MATNADIKGLETPCFLVDKERLQRNVDWMIGTCKNLGISLRCHTKTHKTIEAAVLSTGGTKSGIAVSTLSEAEAYAYAGFDDILLAYPMTQSKVNRCIKLMEKVPQFHVLVSDLSGVECLKNNLDKLPDGRKWSVAIEIDPGYARTGFLVNSNEFDMAFKDVMKYMTLLTIYCHCGGSYGCPTKEQREKNQEGVVNHLIRAKSRVLSVFRDANFTIGTGSSPSCSHPSDTQRQLDEFHPGNYVFYDYQQYLLGSCRESDIACRVMTRVIAHKEDQCMILVDCGFLALGHDGIHQRPHDFCLFDGQSNLKMIGMTQEIGKVKAKEGDLDCKKYPVGTLLYIYPFHSCLTAALHQVFHVHSGDKLVDTWTPVKGW